ncbi:MAG TPA: nicotinamide riboside transporter PnuC [Lacunisphaera sp.]|nr:nicotinamide riboside transporter PnuC [Lacunisphaera sp.]
METAVARARTPPNLTWELAGAAVASALVVAASYQHWWPITVTEAWGFATGGVCVWLVVREHTWNWPIGLANNLVFFVLFLRGRLYAGMWLQAVYFGLGLYGWLNWIHGGADRTALKVSRTTRIEWGLLAAAVPLATWGLREILVGANGAAPFWDSLTTVISLAAQYLLCRKRIENWWLWIVADLIYVPLYLSRSLPLTAVLYAVFLVMCLCGLRAWRRSLEGAA